MESRAGLPACSVAQQFRNLAAIFGVSWHGGSAPACGARGGLSSRAGAAADDRMGARRERRRTALDDIANQSCGDWYGGLRPSSPAPASALGREVVPMDTVDPP